MSLDTFSSKKFYPVLAANVLKPVDIREKNTRQGVAPQDTQAVQQTSVSHPLERRASRGANQKLVTRSVKSILGANQKLVTRSVKSILGANLS